MFERFTERARRIILFARDEARDYGSPYVESEHFLLGLLREDNEPEIRAALEKRITRRERLSASVELPLSAECERILNFAAEVAGRYEHPWVGTEHLLLGILREDTSLAAQVLASCGIKPHGIYEKIAQIPSRATLVTLESFLAELKYKNSDQLIDYFAMNAEFIDVSGRRWNREELRKCFHALFAHYAKKNTSYIVETGIANTRALFVATVLWKNALLASEERVWMHRMTATLVAEGGWKILLLEATAAVPSVPADKETGATTANTIVGEIDSRMRFSGIPNSEWYVGVTSDIEERLFGFHRVPRQDHWFIYRRCANAETARALEAAYHWAGCKGSTGGGKSDCVFLYAYVISPATVQ